MAKKEYYDCTGKIGPLFNYNLQPEWPMYSFNHPSHIVWNAIAGKFHEAGWSDNRIKDWLQSKDPRWALGRDLGDMLTAAAEAYATKILQCPPEPEG
jgi:hypothetical protein